MTYCVLLAKSVFIKKPCFLLQGIIQVTADAQESQTTVDKELEQLERAKRVSIQILSLE